MSRFVGASAARALLVFLIVCLGTGAARAQDTCDAGGVLCSSVVVIDPFGGQKLEQTFCCPGEVCIESKCWASPPRCNVDADCGLDGGICGSGKICKCTSDAQCGPNLICQDEHCVLACDDNGDCGEGLQCFQGVLCKPIPCKNNDDCGDAGTCDDRDHDLKVCRVRCFSSDECGKFGTCWPGGRCAPPCESSLECDGGICLDGERYCVARGEPLAESGFSCTTGRIGAGSASFLLLLPLVFAGLRWARRRRVDSERELR